METEKSLIMKSSMKNSKKVTKKEKYQKTSIKRSFSLTSKLYNLDILQLLKNKSEKFLIKKREIDLSNNKGKLPRKTLLNTNLNLENKDFLLNHQRQKNMMKTLRNKEVKDIGDLERKTFDKNFTHFSDCCDLEENKNDRKKTFKKTKHFNHKNNLQEFITKNKNDEIIPGFKETLHSNKNNLKNDASLRFLDVIETRKNSNIIKENKKINKKESNNERKKNSKVEKNFEKSEKKKKIIYQNNILPNTYPDDSKIDLNLSAKEDLQNRSKFILNFNDELVNLKIKRCNSNFDDEFKLFESSFFEEINERIIPNDSKKLGMNRKNSISNRNLNDFDIDNFEQKNDDDYDFYGNKNNLVKIGKSVKLTIEKNIKTKKKEKKLIENNPNKNNKNKGGNYKNTQFKKEITNKKLEIKSMQTISELNSSQSRKLFNNLKKPSTEIFNANLNKQKNLKVSQNREDKEILKIEEKFQRILNAKLETEISDLSNIDIDKKYAELFLMNDGNLNCDPDTTAIRIKYSEIEKKINKKLVLKLNSEKKDSKKNLFQSQIDFSKKTNLKKNSINDIKIIKKKYINDKEINTPKKMIEKSSQVLIKHNNQQGVENKNKANKINHQFQEDTKKIESPIGKDLDYNKLEQTISVPKVDKLIKELKWPKVQEVNKPNEKIIVKNMNKKKIDNDEREKNEEIIPKNHHKLEKNNTQINSRISKLKVVSKTQFPTLNNIKTLQMNLPKHKIVKKNHLSFKNLTSQKYPMKKLLYLRYSDCSLLKKKSLNYIEKFNYSKSENEQINERLPKIMTIYHKKDKESLKRNDNNKHFEKKKSIEINFEKINIKSNIIDYYQKPLLESIKKYLSEKNLLLNENSKTDIQKSQKDEYNAIDTKNQVNLINDPIKTSSTYNYNFNHEDIQIRFLKEETKNPKTENNENLNIIRHKKIQNYNKILKSEIYKMEKPQSPKKINFLDHFKINYNNFQILNKYDIYNKSYNYPFNLNLNCIQHNVKVKRYLVLDMDETLIHSSKKKINENSIKVEKSLYFTKRPYLDEFLSNMSKLYNIIIFTCSEEKYAESILNKIDPHQKLFFMKFFRGDCIFINNNVFLKNLEFFTDFNYAKAVFIDNSPMHFYRNLDNTVPIIPFYGNLKDTELINLEVFLKNISRKKDFRNFIQNKFFLKELRENIDFDTLLKNIIKNFE